MSRFEPFFDRFAVLPAVGWQAFQQLEVHARPVTFAVPAMEDSAKVAVVQHSVVESLRSGAGAAPGAASLRDRGVTWEDIHPDLYRKVFSFWHSLLHRSATILHDLGQDCTIGSCTGFKIYGEPCCKTCAWLHGKVTVDQTVIERFTGPWHFGCVMTTEGEDEGHYINLDDVPNFDDIERMFSPWDFLRAQRLLPTELPTNRRALPVAPMRKILERSLKRRKDAYESRGRNSAEDTQSGDGHPNQPNKSE
jgi:hypothetical protein